MNNPQIEAIAQMVVEQFWREANLRAQLIAARDAPSPRPADTGSAPGDPGEEVNDGRR